MLGLKNAARASATDPLQPPDRPLRRRQLSKYNSHSPGDVGRRLLGLHGGKSVIALGYGTIPHDVDAFAGARIV
jgi:hypothetical protein